MLNQTQFPRVSQATRTTNNNNSFRDNHDDYQRRLSRRVSALQSTDSMSQKNAQEGDPAVQRTQIHVPQGHDQSRGEEEGQGHEQKIRQDTAGVWGWAFRIDKKEEEEDYSKLSRRYSGSFRIDEMEEVVDSSKLSPCYSGLIRINKEEKEMYSSKLSRRYSGCDTEEDSDIDSEEMMDINMDMSRDEMEDRMEKLSV